MKLLYWNTKGCSISFVEDILLDQRPDILFLSEFDEEDLEKNDRAFAAINYEYFPNPGCIRVKIIKEKSINLDLNIQTSYYTIVYNNNIDLYVVSVHLPSQMFNHMDSLKNYIRNMREEIDGKIGRSDDKRILFIGDFNVNPFESPMIGFDGFSASNSRKSRVSVGSYGDEKYLYYNPTWKLYAENNFPGTKYFARPSTTSFDVLEHHFLDQVVMSKKLADDLESENISLLHKTKNNVYFNDMKNEVLISDHLPLIYTIKIK